MLSIVGLKMFFKAFNLILFIYFRTLLSFVATEECGYFDLPCDDGECIDREYWCDDSEHCDDGSDEKYCSTADDIDIACNENLHFRCYDGGCIPLVGHCNDYINCDDGSDEVACFLVGDECEEDEFKCKSVGCIPMTKRCNGNKDCADWSDEDFCPEPSVVDVSIDVHTETKVEGDLSELVARDKALKWLLSQQQQDFSWGEDTPRALIAMALTSTMLSNDTGMQLAVQQLSGEIAVNLARNSGGISLYRLARYVMALIATCQNPYNFYGFDLVHDLRTRTNRVIEKEFVGPSIFLALCLVNQTRSKDFHVVHKMSWSMTHGYNTNPSRKLFDLEAYSAIASSCMLKSHVHDNAALFSDLLNRTFTSYFYAYQDVDVYTVALLLQGLNAWSSVPISPLLTHRRKLLMSSLLKKQNEDGSFGDLLATYFALPALQGKSFGDLQDIDCWKSRSGRLSSYQEYPSLHNQDFFSVEISLWLTSISGTQTNCMKFSVPPNWTLFNAMRFAQTKNPLYRFEYDKPETGKTVYSISDIPNDGEKKMYWTLYINQLNNTDFISRLTLGNIFYRKPRMTPYTDGMENYMLLNNDNVVFWYMPII